MDILDFENSTYSVNLRKLTRKSRLGSGYRDIKDITIQDIMIMNKHKELIKIYFGLGKINFTDDILDYMKRQHNLLIGERSAEKIKIEVGSAMTELKDAPEDLDIRGRDLVTGIPKVVKITYSEIAFAMDKSISKIEEAVLKALESSPPELSADIYDNGIYLTGGGALLRGLDKRLNLKTKLPIHVAEEPLRAVVRGTGIALKNIDGFRAVLMS